MHVSSVEVLLVQHPKVSHLHACKDTAFRCSMHCSPPPDACHLFLMPPSTSSRLPDVLVGVNGQGMELLDANASLLGAKVLPSKSSPGTRKMPFDAL